MYAPTFSFSWDDRAGAYSGRDIGTFCALGVEGEVDPDLMTGLRTFNTDIDADVKALRQISGALLPVLEGKGPIALAIGSVELTLPTTGLTQPLSRFKSICFGSL